MDVVNLVAMLETIIAHLKADDSYEGSFEYHATDTPGEFEVQAAYRVGNRDGQGGMILVRGREA